MIEILIAAVAGAVAASIAIVGRRAIPRARAVFREPEFDGWAQDDPAAGPHEHDGHIAGTSIRGGVKHKRMYCALCSKKWSEPL